MRAALVASRAGREDQRDLRVELPHCGRRRAVVALLALSLVACDGFPLVGPLFRGDESKEPKTGSIVIIFPCPPFCGPPPDSLPPEPLPPDSTDWREVR